MSLVIWEPARYESGFHTATIGSFVTPINGNTLAAPYDKDTKVTEVTHFTGWKQTYFRETGEFEAETFELEPGDVKAGYMVDFDGDFFIIENFIWKLTDKGYKCTISGRDFWKYPDSMVKQRVVGSRYNLQSQSSPMSGLHFGMYIQYFFRYPDLQAGWFRDTRRFPWATITQYYANDLLRYDFANAAAFKARTAGAEFCSEIMSYGAEWRTFCQWFNCGLKFEIEFNSTAGMFTIHPVLYDGSNNGVTIRTNSRGVKNFEYEYSTQAAINATFSRFESLYAIVPNSSEYVPFVTPDYGAYLRTEKVKSTLPSFSDSATNYPERVAFWSEKYYNVSESPDTADASGSAAVVNWINQLASEQFVANEISFKFDYDNSGMYRYGEHFKLGDTLTIIDEYLGASASQRLTGVKTVYDDEKTYEFEFGEQKIKQSDILRRKFSEIDIRTY